MKLKNKYLIIATMILSLIAFALSVSSWFFTDDGMNLIDLEKNVRGMMGSFIDRTIQFAYLSNIIVPVMCLVPPITLACFTLKQKNQFDLMSKPLIISMFVFSIILLAISMAAIIETSNLFNQKWIIEHKK